MAIHGANFTPTALNICGSSIFGRYPKISTEKTYNMFISDNFMVPYSGYEIAINYTKLDQGQIGRGIFNSTRFNKIVAVIGPEVYLVDIIYDQAAEKIIYTQIQNIGTLTTTSGPVYIVENNRPQIVISDGQSIYVYDPNFTSPQTSAFQAVPGLDFTPGYITFHDTYVIAAATNDTSSGSPGANNTWRLSTSNQAFVWPSTSSFVGSIQTKPDVTQAVVRFPSKGNMIFVMGKIVTEAWFDTGTQLFPYQRQNQFNIDYGCLSPATVAYMDEYVVWLAANEKSGPIIMYSDGGMPQKITTDGIDYLFSQLAVPEDSQAFLYRQDGHLFYHINFYTDNLSLYYDFNTHKFYNACDQNGNYFIASELCYFQNQYYFVSKNSGNIYAFDTIFTTYQDTINNSSQTATIVKYEIPRIRITHNIRMPSQDYFIANDAGFTIESGETNYVELDEGPIQLITQDGNLLITQAGPSAYISQDGIFLETQDGNLLSSQEPDSSETFDLIAQQRAHIYATPRVDLSISTDGGASFGNNWAYNLPAIGNRKNRLMWWQLGVVNDLVCQFKFWGIGRFVVTDGIVNIRQ